MEEASASAAERAGSAQAAATATETTADNAPTTPATGPDAGAPASPTRRAARGSPGQRRGRDYVLSPPGARDEAVEELTQQMVAMGQAMADMSAAIERLQLKNSNLEASMSEAQAVAVAARTDPAREHIAKAEKSELRSVKKLYPEKYNPTTDNYRE